ncbi:MAG: nucleotidyltransferase domain-containing protein [Candidatus Pacearchaeota archaeon]|nr:nucleotidyltransferase domain-containing protein [Candidatus Pacearchaeota archaeon]
MSTLLKSGHTKILRLFYENKKASFHLREIARRTKLYANSATRFLNQLEKEGILTSQKDGNLKKYNIKKSEKLSNIFASFDIERLNKLPLSRRRAITYFLDKLHEKPIIALLFGSTAKETFRKDSDIDLLLIVNKKIDVDTAKDYVDAQIGIKINCFQITYEEFKKEIKLKEDKVIQSALNTGYPIFNQMLFYEVYLNGY